MMSNKNVHVAMMITTAVRILNALLWDTASTVEKCDQIKNRPINQSK